MKMLNKTIWSILLLLCVPVAWAQVEQVPLDVQDRQLRRLASEFERTGELDRASDVYYLLCMQNPADITSYEGAKRVMLQLQQLDRLQEMILEMQKSRRDIRYPVDLANIEYLRGNHKAALAHWDQVLDNNATSQNAYVLVGLALTRNGLFDEAVDCYLQGRRKLKRDNIFIFELAALYAEQGQYKEVAREYIRFLENNPKQQPYVDSRFKALEAKPESIKPFIETLQDAIKEKAEIRFELHQILGNIYARNLQYEKARDQFIILEDSLRQYNDQRLGFYLYQFAELCTNEGQLTLARECFEMLIREYPNSRYVLQARLGFAAILEHKGEYRQAIENYEQFIEKFPRSTEAHNALLRIGDIYSERLDDPSSAIATWKRLLKGYPRAGNRTETLFKLGECEIRNNELGNARANFNMVLMENKKNNERRKKALYAMAHTWFLEGNVAKCQEYLQQYFNSELTGNNADVYENDALELNMLLTENMMDSVGLATLAKATLLSIQKQYQQSDSLLATFIDNNPDTPLYEQIGLFRAKINIERQAYPVAATLLDSLYRNEQFLYRDKALWTLANLYAGPLDQKPQAVELYESLLVKFPESIYIEASRKKIRNLQ